MGQQSGNCEKGLALLGRVQDKYRCIWEGRSPKEAAGVALYLLPHEGGDRLQPTRPRALGLYCPQADQRKFPSGLRFCINPTSGWCTHHCQYCYAAGYQPQQVTAKPNFASNLRRDIADLRQFGVPATPVHLSNSTDPFQPLESELGLTRLAAELLVEHRECFTTVTFLTKNPSLAAQPAYLELLTELAHIPAGHACGAAFAQQGLPGVRVEVSLTFWRDEVRQMFEPGAPSIGERIEAIRSLRNAGIPVVLRIDPLLPRDPIGGKHMADFGLPDVQPLADLENLVLLAREVGAMHVVYSVAKLVRPRGRDFPEVMQKMRLAYEHLAASRALLYKGPPWNPSWRLPWDVAKTDIVAPFLDLCSRFGVTAKFCKQNLIETP